MKLFGLRISRIPAFLTCVRMSVSAPKAYLGLISGAWSVLRNKQDLPPPFVAKKRMRICIKCPHNSFNLCTKCGCYIPYKVSATPLVSPCPARLINPNHGWM